MDLGQRILKARQEAGLSQRQLCGDEITRNMLSQIEHGTARPSMATLQYLAGRLGKNISYFLEEDPVDSPNYSCMQQARAAFAAGDHGLVCEKLGSYRSPDPIFDPEYHLMRTLSLMALAEQAIKEDRQPYALSLLEQAGSAGEQTPLYTPGQERTRLLLLIKAGAPLKPVLARLKGEDDILLLKAEDALSDGLPMRSAVLLDAAEDHEDPKWNLLRGKVHLVSEEFSLAVQCLHRAEESYPKETAPLLERCYRELEDFKQAYFYACKQR